MTTASGDIKAMTNTFYNCSILFLSKDIAENGNMYAHIGILNSQIKSKLQYVCRWMIRKVDS